MDTLEGVRSGIDTLSTLGISLPMSGATAMVALALFVWKRTRSAHSLMARLWQIFHGKKECPDTEIGAFLDEQSALMQFRFTTGVPARTRKQSIALIDWTRRHNENIAAVAACGPYFDLENITLKDEKKLPNRKSVAARFVLTWLLCCMTVIFVLGLLSDNALLQIKKSGTYLFLSAEYAKPIRYGVGFSRETCLNDKGLSESGFSAADANLICEIFKTDKNLVPYLRTTVQQQKVAFAMITLAFVWFGWGAFVGLMQSVRSREMFNRLSKRQEQISLALIKSQEQTEAP